MPVRTGFTSPRGSWQADALPTQYLSMGAALNNLVPNPFFGLVQTGALSQPTVKQGQLLLPFPEYTGVSEAADIWELHLSFAADEGREALRAGRNCAGSLHVL